MKRLFDLLLVAISLPLLLPLFFIIASLVLLNLRSPLFFSQVRSGKDGKPFRIIKFRTMKNDRDQNGEFLPDFVRLTKFGRFLRSTSMDELPELWNVFKGDMSLVGPRPLLIEYLQLYSPEQARRHDVRPGVTGWAQVNGRNAISWGEKFSLDVWYVDHQSLWLDFKILFLTMKRVFQRHGINAVDHDTAPPFKGNV